MENHLAKKSNAKELSQNTSLRPFFVGENLLIEPKKEFFEELKLLDFISEVKVGVFSSSKEIVSNNDAVTSVFSREN